MTERDPGTSPDNHSEPTPNDDVQTPDPAPEHSGSLAESLSDPTAADPTLEALRAGEGTASDALPDAAVAAVVPPAKKKKKARPVNPVKPMPTPVEEAPVEQSLLWPGEEDEIESKEPIPPSRRALIALGILGVVMFVLAGIVFGQNAATAQKQYSVAQVNVMVELLKKEKITFTTAQTTKMGEAWRDQGVNIDPTASQLRDLVTAQVPDKKVTEANIQTQIDKNKTEAGQSPLRMPTANEIESSFRTQALIFAGLGLVVALAAFIYFRRNKWGRILGMFASGLITVMYLMQLVSGAVSLPVIVVTLAGAAAFWFTLQGRLMPLTPRPGGMGGNGFGGGLAGLFRPKPRA